MAQKINSKKLFLATLIFFLASNSWLLFAPIKAFAADDISLIIQPQKTEIKGSSGSKFKDQFAVVNRGASAIRLKLKVSDFLVSGENKKIEFFEAVENPMKEWIIPEFLEIILKPMEAKNIKFITAIPEKIKSGSHLGAIVLEPVGKNSAAPLGMLLLVNVVDGEGMAVTGGRIDEFSVSMIQGYPVRFQIQLANLGNTYLKTESKIILKDWRRRPVAELAGAPQIIYPDNYGLIKWRWNNDNLKFGLFRVELELTNLQNKNNKLADAAWTLIVPWKQLAWWLLAAALLFFFLFKYRRKFSFLRRLGDFKKIPLPGFKKTV